MRFPAVFLLLTTSVAAPPAAHADTLRCGASLVQTGDPAVVVRASCGEPDHVAVAWFAAVPGIAPERETWTYDRGPRQLLRVLHFRNGRLRHFEFAGYGLGRDAAADCGPGQIVPGMVRYRLLRLCGEPVQRERQGTVFPTRLHWTLHPHRGNRSTPIEREVWIYNFGRRHFLREVWLENGVVVEVDHGARGFD